MVAAVKFSVQVPLPPGDIAINRAWRPKKDVKGFASTQIYKESRKLLADEFRIAAGHESTSQQVRVQIIASWPDDDGDVDAPIKGVLDALQAARVILDDKQVVHVTAAKRVDKNNPGLWVSVGPA